MLRSLRRVVSLSPRDGLPLPLPLSPRAGLPLPLSPRAAMSVSIQLQPSPRCLFDEPLEVRVSGLSPLQQVTLKAWLRDDKEQLFHSAAFYTADPRGQLDLAHSPSLGGHYTGVQPMGLFWSLSPVTPFTRLVKRDVATSPLSVHIEIFEGHWSLGQLPAQPLATAINQRWFMKEGLLRIPVREGRIRGTLFIPPGDGPFPGVIDLYGSVGGMVEHRASLLANHGFLTLALGYFGFDDLPQDFMNLDLEYFEEAVNFLRSHPKVKGPGVGAIGISKGGDLVLSMTTFLPHVIAAVSIGGCNANTLGNLHYKGITLPGLGATFERIKFLESKLVDISEVTNDPMEEENKDCIIPIEKAEGHFLFVVGEDDKNWRTPLYAQQAVEKLKENGKENYELITYPEAGHLLEPSYFPFCYASFHRLVGQPVVWGGKKKPHALAQIDLWPRMQAFLRKHLEHQSKL
ncbi:acyl-coenzyme A thioesterase 1-like [Hemiscyllium ocellatum]|uniref:acyl-coenzyme A thioesterase 1-like n=2 Tax=Hemiscyllium ocellatum TaxID=170820 RepID=UPI00296665E9|nr:acyl-coenzyme A thioesterase 1-like [Hemiscyllium ocellatum]